MLRSALAPLVAVAALVPLAFAADPPSLGDEFDDAATLKNWTVLKSGRDALQTKLDIGRTQKGWLALTPRANTGWYNDGVGPLLSKEIEGDFLIETRVVTRRTGAPDEAPRATYNSGGLIVRDPASAGRNQNWVVVNVGRQDPDTGTEVKSTVNSESKLELQRGAHTGRLRLARIGTTVYALKRLDGEDRWTQLKELERRDLPARVQIGLMANGWGAGADVNVEYDYFRVSVPKAAADLTADK